MSMTNRRARDRADIVLGEDWDRPAGTVESELRAARQRRSMFTLNRSPLARKIIMFNLLAIVILVAGVMYLNPFRDSLVHQRERALAIEAQLIADIFEASLPRSAPANLVTGDGIDPVDVLDRIGFADGVDVFVFADPDTLVASTLDRPRAPTRPVRGLAPQEDERLLITNFLNGVWSGLSNLVGSDQTVPQHGTPESLARSIVTAANDGATVLRRSNSVTGAAFAAATPIEGPNGQVGVLVVTTAAGEIDQLVRGEREELLQMFVVALFVSIGLSFVLASTIANPLSDLAAAAELGRDKNARKMSPTRVRIPDLTGRPDEIGRLSGALRGMVSALYDRIDANEQFAADVSHEIKNPLASLRSAVGTMRVARTDEQRNRLLEVIEHDVQRLDRLVSDISNASRLDSELVKEEEEEFDLVRTLENLSQYHRRRGREERRRLHHRPAARTDPDLGAGGAAGAGLREPAVERHLLLRGRRRGAPLDPPPRQPRADRGRGYRPRHPRRGADEDVQPLLLRTPGKAVRQPFRPRPRDLQADRRGAWRRDLGREHPPDRSRHHFGTAGRALRRRPADLRPA
jgi:two-component system sensor histidine kinase ChvG